MFQKSIRRHPDPSDSSPGGGSSPENGAGFTAEQREYHQAIWTISSDILERHGILRGIDEFAENRQGTWVKIASSRDSADRTLLKFSDDENYHFSTGENIDRDLAVLIRPGGSLVDNNRISTLEHIVEALKDFREELDGRR